MIRKVHNPKLYYAVTASEPWLGSLHPFSTSTHA